MSRQRQYIDFNLELRDLDLSNNTFKVSVPISAVGETREAFSVAYISEEMKGQLKKLDRKRIQPKELIELGKQLTSRLFPSEEIRTLFQKAIDKAGSEGGIRLRLLIRHLKLAQLPWEFCYLPVPEGEEDSYDNFLVLNPKFSIVRHEAINTPPSEIHKENQNSLRLLAVTANARTEGFSALNLEIEQEAIEEALDGFSVDGISLNWQPFINDPTVDELISVLDKKADLFHFAGHGVFKEEDADPETQEPKGVGSLVLIKNKTEGSPALLPANLLAKHLQQAGVRVALLGACHSGRRDEVSPWTGVAPALIKDGIAVVVAMQYAVIDMDAIAFSKRFYTALAAGLSVDEAVSLARLAVYSQSKERYEWGVPVLYMRSPNGIIFPELTRTESKTASELRVEGEARIKTIKGGKFRVVEIEKVVRANQITGKLQADTIENVDSTVVLIKEA